MKPFVFEANNNMETGPPHEVKYIEKKRKCVLCGKRISGYNRANQCQSHGVTKKTEGWFNQRRIVVKKRTPTEAETVKRWMMDF